MVELSLAAVWRDLGGPELRGKRARAFWRKGDGLNISLDLGRGVWFDHVQGTGGGVILLVGTVLSCSRQEAILWLRQNHHLPAPRAILTDRRVWSYRRKHAEEQLKRARCWHAALIHELLTTKAEAYSRWCEVVERPDLDSSRAQLKEWAEASARLFEVEALRESALVDQFAAEQARDPIGTRRLVDVGRHDYLSAERITALVVRVLAVESERRLAA